MHMKKIVLEGIYDRGTLNSEAVVLEVKVKTNLKYFMVVDTTYTKNNLISNKHRHSYWFVDQPVEPGDIIVLYTGKGKNNQVGHKNGKNTVFNFYWGLGSSVWNNDGDAALLYQIETWSTLKVNQ
jgi:hypothetical protein